MFLRSVCFYLKNKEEMLLNETYFVTNEYSLFQRILVTIILSSICIVGVIGKF